MAGLGRPRSANSSSNFQRLTPLMSKVDTVTFDGPKAMHLLQQSRVVGGFDTRELEAVLESVSWPGKPSTPYPTP